MTTSTQLWQRFRQYFLRYDELGFSLDISRMDFWADFFADTAMLADQACVEMKKLEAGAIANIDENRMVGHYWLRNAALAPSKDLQKMIEDAKASIVAFGADIHSGKIVSTSGKPFTDVLVVGIGGSALGPQFMAHCLGGAGDKLRMHYFDNTDPDGMNCVIALLGEKLATTLVVVISKSGGTKESRNGMLAAQDALKKIGADCAKHFVAVTGVGSALDETAAREGWIARFPMWDWVGGRTSVMSAVGLVPMVLQGLDIENFLAGAAAMDVKTRTDDIAKNASMLLALMWFHSGNGSGIKDMVILPYKDRLLLFSRYLQQLIMESIGKEFDRDGERVNQGIAVYGNKGSTDQHAYVQQLREGLNNFFVSFIEVRKSADTPELVVEADDITSGDYLQGFLRGTRDALYEKERESLTISIEEVNAFSVGLLIALYERAVGFYASLVNVNAYHQPGVEAGKKAAENILELQKKTAAFLANNAGKSFTAEQLAAALETDPEKIFHIATHLAANKDGFSHSPGRTPSDDTFAKN